MTCIVGFTDKKNNTTWIGADSLGSNGYTQAVESNPKVFRNSTLKNVVMGSTSTFRHIDLLKYSKNLFPEIDKYKIPSGETVVNHEYMVTAFIPNIIKLFEDGIKEADKGGNFLVGIDGKLYEIQSDFSVLEPMSGYSSVGCGEVAAKGSLYATSKNFGDKLTPEEHIICALEAAEKNCVGVQRPFVILNTKNEEVIIIGLDGKRKVIGKKKETNKKSSKKETTSSKKLSSSKSSKNSSDSSKSPVGTVVKKFETAFETAFE